MPSVTWPFTVTLFQPDPAQSPARFVGRAEYLFGPEGLSLTKPPYGRMTAIDLTTGEHRWMVPVGDGPRHHPALTGSQSAAVGLAFPNPHTVDEDPALWRSGGATSRECDGRDGGSPLSFDAEIFDPKLRAFDKVTGDLVGEIALPANVTGAPMTYMAGGRQYIVVAVGGANVPAELVALRLP